MLCALVWFHVAYENIVVARCRQCAIIVVHWSRARRTHHAQSRYSFLRSHFAVAVAVAVVHACRSIVVVCVLLDGFSLSPSLSLLAVHLCATNSLGRLYFGLIAIATKHPSNTKLLRTLRTQATAASDIDSCGFVE